jgi:putative redox protein
VITRTSRARYSGAGTRFVARTGTGHEIILDDDPGDTGARPVELLLVAQAGCTGFDVITALREEGQPVTGYEVTVTAEQRDEAQPAIYKRAIVIHEVEGDVDAAVLRRGIQASATTYSSVTAMLAAGTVEVHHRYRIARTNGEVQEGEVLVTGPRADPDMLGQAQSSGWAE